MFEKIKKKKEQERKLEELNEYLDYIIINYGYEVKGDFDYYGSRPHSEIHIYHDDYINIERHSTVSTYGSKTYRSDKRFSIAINKNLPPGNYAFIWTSGNDMIDDDLFEYIKDIPNKEKQKQEQANKIELQKKLELEKEQKKREIELSIMASAAKKCGHVIEAVKYLKDYEDNLIKIKVDLDYTFNSDHEREYYVKNIEIILKTKNAIVFRETNYSGQYVSVYRPGNWEKYLLTVYENKKKQDEIAKKQIEIKEQREKQKVLKFERERYLPIDD